MNDVSVRLVFDRKHVATKVHKSLVQLEVLFQSKRKFISTGVKLCSNQWSSTSRVKNHPQQEILNNMLSEKVMHVYDFVYELKKQNQQFTFEKLQQFLDGANPNSKTSFLDYMRICVEERPIQENTKKHHRSVLRALEDFGLIKTFEDLSVQNIRKWDEYAKKRCKFQSSVYNYHKILKIYVRSAFLDEHIKKNPYDSIKLEKGKQSIRKFLAPEELKTLESKKIENISLQQVRDVFLFCCYTGLAYSDLVKFDFNNAVLTNGLYRIRDCRQKTGVKYNITLIDKAMEILKKYQFALPVISNQKYNAYLKILGAYCDIKKRLTSHVARHTFATTITMANGVRIEVISKMLGHTNIRTTQLYAQTFQSEVDSEFNRLNNLFHI